MSHPPAPSIPPPGSPPEPSWGSICSHLALGEGALAALQIQALRAGRPDLLSEHETHYWLGLAYLLALEWSRATTELRAYLASDASSARAGWAFLHLGRAYEQLGHADEASLAYRGCLAVPAAERAARRLAFDLMSRLAGSLPIGYGQASSRPTDHGRGR